MPNSVVLFTTPLPPGLVEESAAPTIVLKTEAANSNPGDQPNGPTVVDYGTGALIYSPSTPRAV